MAAMIEYLCTAQHDLRGEASITVEQGLWAYCSWGAGTGHQWTRIDPTNVEALRSLAGNGHTKPVSSEEEQPSRSRRRT